MPTLEWMGKNMVFAHDPQEGTGAYAIDEFRQILGQIG